MPRVQSMVLVAFSVNRDALTFPRHHGSALYQVLLLTDGAVVHWLRLSYRALRQFARDYL